MRLSKIECGEVEVNINLTKKKENQNRRFSSFQDYDPRNPPPLLRCRESVGKKRFLKYHSGHLSQLPWLIGKIVTFLKIIEES